MTLSVLFGMLILLRVQADDVIDPELGQAYNVLYFDTANPGVLVTLVFYNLDGESNKAANTFLWQDPVTGREWYYNGDGGVFFVDERPPLPEPPPSVEFDYGPKFRLEYTRWDGVEIKEEIWKKDYSGPVIEVDGGAEPFVLRRENEQDILATFRGSSAQVTLLSNVSKYFYELFEGDEREYVLKHFVDDVQTWIGWIAPDVFSEPYRSGPYTTQVRFVDGIGMLKNTPIPEINENGYKGMVSEKDVIIRCLDTLSYEIPVKIACNIFEENMLPGVPPIEQSFVNMEAFVSLKNGENQPLSCYDALEKILKSWNAVLFQENSTWYVIREPELAGDTLNLDIYDYRGRQTGSETVTLEKTFTDLGIKLHGATLETVRASRNVTFIQEFGGLLVPNNNFALNGSFEQWEEYSREGSIIHWKAKDWVYNGLSVYPWRLNTGHRGQVGRIEEYQGINQTNNYLQILEVRRSFDVDGPLGYISTPKVPVKKELGNLIAISFKVRANTYDKRKELVEAYFVAGLQIGTKHLGVDEDGNYVWNDTLTYLRWRVGSLFTWETVSIDGIPIPEDGDLEFRCYQMVQIGRVTRNEYAVNWDDVNVRLASNDAILYKNIYFTTANDSVFTDAVEEQTVKLGDALTVMSQNAKIVEGKNTLNWNRKGIDESQKLVYILCREYLNQYQRTAHKLTNGRCRAPLTMIAKYQDDQIDTTVYYILTGGDYKEKSGEWSPYFHEINQTETTSEIREVAEANTQGQGAPNGGGQASNSGDTAVPPITLPEDVDDGIPLVTDGKWGDSEIYAERDVDGNISGYTTAHPIKAKPAELAEELVTLGQIPTISGGIPDAPNNGNYYARRSLGWSSFTPFSGDYADLAGKPAILESEERESDTVLFDKNYVIGNAAARTGNIVLDATGAKIGAVTRMIHNSSTKPTISGLTFKVLSGIYAENVDNYIWFAMTKKTGGSEIVEITVGQDISW